MKRSALKRRTPLKPARGRRRAAKRRPLDSEGSVAWRLAALERPCAVCGSVRGVQGHHVLTVQSLRRELPAEVFERVRWDVANLLSLCAGCHASHHAGSVRVPRALLPMEAVVFADGLGLGWLLDRCYPKEDG